MRKLVLLGIVFFVSLVGSPSLMGQIVINEFLASNNAINVDPDYDDYADWIELYNAGSAAVSLKGYYLTDNISNPSKWKITSDVQIQAKGFLLIWADGMDAGLHTNFRLSASGEELALVSPALVVLDSIIYNVQEIDVSYGRKQDGGNEWAFFQTPTPAAKNSSVSYHGIVYSVPSFSVEGGIYSSAQTVQIKSLFGGDVRYTLDGSEPGLQSFVALEPITVSKNTVIRARIYKPGQIMGPIVTHSYFIDPNHEIGKLPVISISSAPENFWDKEKGIYVVHSTKPTWEIPINIELFENDGSDRAAFNLPAGAKSTGLYSWQLPEKMLGISFRKEYGASKLEYPLIFEKQRKVYDTFSIRASGSDWASTLFRDGLTQTAAVYNTNLDNSGFRACVVYINGEFMGIHNIREKIDEDYIVGNYGLESGTFDMIEEVDGGINVETGDDNANTYFISLTDKDLSIQANYDAVADIMDIEDFTDMVVTEVYTGNSSIGHNLMKWKPKDSGKWKWILMDFDRGFSGITSDMISFYLKESGWPFKDLMNNDGYKKYFGRKLADLLFTTFNTDRIIQEIDDHKNEIEDLIPSHVKRWEGTSGTGNYSSIKAIPSVNSWLSEVEKLKEFAQARPAVILSDLTNYGFESPLALSVSTIPANAGQLTFNGLNIPLNDCVGAYPANEEIKLVALAKPGYRFMGWQGSESTLLIPKESTWKYYDKGAEPSGNWKGPGFDDSNWSSGQAELGYGDGDENTTVSYGSSSSNKYITTYFRKSFSVSNKNLVQSLNFEIKCDDGAVVYINGQEIERQNMPTGTINYGTTANSSVGGSAESAFTAYTANTNVLVNGVNIIAVEIHQSDQGSSDISFDLQLSVLDHSSENYLSTQSEYVITMDGAKELSAIFESTGQCLVDAEIDHEVTLSKACSPYIVPNNVNITASGKLIIEKGVELLMGDGVSIFAHGPIIAKGTESEPIRFRSNPESDEGKWGMISFNNVQDTSHFSYVIVEDATHGPHPVQEIAAISLFHSNIKMDHLTIENVYGNPIVARYSDVTLADSYLHSEVTGDLINVKYGKAYIENCTFKGNDQPDTDAIDYDDVDGGVIRNCTISDMHGFNSDAIDIGERAKNILIDKVFTYNITDKGVSVGQQSSVHISYSVFTNSNLGAGLKDSSFVTIDHCTYYGTNIAVACYEKNLGDAGANAIITNSILSNCYDESYLCDEYSTIDISYSASDNERLPDGKNNVFGDPQFTNPTFFDFKLHNGSPCVSAGKTGDIGAGIAMTNFPPNIVISDIAYLTDPAVDMPEFIGITNISDIDVNISGYQFTRGITYEFPQGVIIKAHERIYVTENELAAFWVGKGAKVFQWESGKLADEGETIQLETDNGIILDGLKYNDKAPWPSFTDALMAITLKSNELDNHFGNNWILQNIDEIVSVEEFASDKVTFKVYPNPSNGMLFITGTEFSGRAIDVYNLAGLKVATIVLNEGQSSFQLNQLQSGIYLLECAGQTQRIMIK